MPPSISGQPRAVALTVALALVSPPSADAQTQGAPPQVDLDTVLPELVITGSGEPSRRNETPSAVSRVEGVTIDLVRPAHPSELLNRLPGVIVEQTNGEGAVVGIRHPITTAPVYLYQQDGVPIQPTGFFNHNALYLLDLPQAGAVEVIRGPGTALQGSDAIAGVVNVLTRAPSAKTTGELSIEVGPYAWVRGLGGFSGTWGPVGVRGDVNLTHTDGWRDHTLYDRRTGLFRVDTVLPGSTLHTTLDLADIYQQTGANSYLSADDYHRNPTRNYTPFAFRRVQGLFLSSAWEKPFGDGVLTITPFLRINTMDLLPSWQLAYDPARTVTSYNSVGAQIRYRMDFTPWRTRLITGVDLDYSPGSYKEDRLRPVRVGPVFTSYTDLGRLYDYDVTFHEVAPYAQVETSPLPALRVTAGLRFDALGYQYRNNLPAGAFAVFNPNSGLTNTIFFRPASTDRSYSHWSPSIGATYALAPWVNAYASYRQSFRIPQQTQLFRQGANLDTVHLQPITADTVEGGFRSGDDSAVKWELAAFHTIKRNDILTLNTGTAPTLTNNGETRHVGLEGAVGWRISPEWRIDVAGSIADHRYVHWTANGVDFAGKRIASAPVVSGSAVATYKPAWLPALTLELEWQHVGSYAIDDADTFSYPGHDLVNVRADYAVTDNIKVFGRVMNVLNTRWATSTQVSGGLPQYAPGMPLAGYGGLALRF